MKIGSRLLDRLLGPADHHAIAALDPPDAAAGADVDVMDALGLDRGGPADVVLVVRVAAVDDDVARPEELGQLLDRGLGRARRRGPSPRRPWGLVSLATNSARVEAPVAPSEASFLTASWLWSKTTHSCPAFISRRTMFPPIRPRPIIPSCTVAAP